MCALKSQMFFSAKQKFFIPVWKMIDKRENLCFNDFIIWVKTLTENLPFQILLQRAGGWCEPVQRELAVCFPSWFCERESQ